MKVKVSERVSIELQKAIFKGEYPPHTRFPSERELAQRYSVSRSAVREAVAKLTQLGLVETRPQSGTYVSDYQTEGSLDLLIHIVRAGEAVDIEVMAGLLKMRRMTEPSIAREAALCAQPGDIEVLRLSGERLIDDILNHPQDTQALSESDFNFHAALMHAAKNLIFPLFFNSFKPIYKFYTVYYYMDTMTHAVTIDFVHKLTMAVENRDPGGAENITHDAIIFAEERLAAVLGHGANDKT